MSQIAPPSAGALERAVTRVSDVSTLPQVALRVIAIANDENSGAREMKEAMEVDPAFSARVLRLVNSSAYGLRQKVTNLQTAISFLGVKQIRNLALTASVSRLFQHDESIGPYRRQGLWRHMVAVATCARLLAMRLRIREFEEAYLAGLLHDLGIILVDQNCHKRFVELLPSVVEGTPIRDLELEHLGFTHSQLGREVASRWKLPEAVVAPIAYHHHSASYRGDQTTLVLCVEMANFVCTLMDMPSIGVNCLAFPQVALADLGLTKADLVALSTDLDRDLKTNQLLFDIQG